MMTNNDVLLFPASSEEHYTRRSSSYNRDFKIQRRDGDKNVA